MGWFYLDTELEDTLNSMARHVLRKYWNFDHCIPIHISGRLTRTLGAYEFRMIGETIKPIRIQLSKDLVKYGSFQFVLFILKHELCHFVLSQLNLPFKDGEDIFENELRRIGAYSTKTVRISYNAYCTTCKKVYDFGQKTMVHSYIKGQKCSCKNSNLVYLGVYYHNKPCK